MRDVLLLLKVAFALTLSSCVSIQSVSLSDISGKPGRGLTAHDSEVGYLHLTTPNLGEVISNLTLKFQKNCDSKNLANVQTVLSVRDFFLAQNYEITMTCDCVAK